MSGAPSPVRWRRPWDAFKRLTAEHCFWMKSEIFLSNCNQNFSAFFRKSSRALGGGRTFQVDVRVIAATNQDLWGMVQERKFRADLYYRLNVFPITLPPLREREDDIPLLVEHFVQKFAKRQGKSIDRIPDEVMEVLKRHDWPGNIRELQNVIERAVIMTTGPVLNLQTTELMTQNVGVCANQDARRRRAGAHHGDAS
jgi:transcriptional regulator with GAF, ATPase, and Fis domain